MLSIVRTTAVFVCLSGLASSAFALAPDFMEKLEADSRPIEDRMRDDARRPYQVMQLLGVEEGMTALDVGAGGGWYTRVLSAAVGPDGHVIAQFGPRALQRDDGQAQKTLAESLGNTEAFFGEVSEIEANSIDVAVTGLNLHHSNAERGVPYLRDILNALKPGGRAVITDHVGLADVDNSQLHRIPPAEVRGWIEEAGFEIVEESDILRTAADDHTLSARDPRLGRNTDRFLFLVRKP